jgi:DNA-binding beta-propeller fold protein YncE
MRTAAAFCALALTLVVCGGGATTSPQPATATIQVGPNPAGIVVGDGAAWLAQAADGTVARIDLGSARIKATIKVGDPSVLRAAGCGAESIHAVPHGSFKVRRCDLPKAVAAVPGAIWATKNDTEELVRIDPRSNRVVAKVPVGIDAWYLAASPTAVWATDFYRDTVVHVDPIAGRVVATITGLPFGPSGIAIAGDSVWVASSRADVISRIDAKNDHVVATMPVDHVPLPVVYAFGSVWVRNEMAEGNGTVIRIDPNTDEVLAKVAVGPEAGRDGLDGLGVAPDGLWVAGLRLQKIDPRSNRVVAVNNHTANAVSYGAGSLWAIDVGYSVTRLTA